MAFLLNSIRHNLKIGECIRFNLKLFLTLCVIPTKSFNAYTRTIIYFAFSIFTTFFKNAVRSRGGTGKSCS